VDEATNRECRRVRRLLIDRALSDRPREALSADADAHLRDCPACARRAGTLAATPALLATAADASAPLYPGALRGRTLAAIATRPAPRYRRLAWAIAPAGALALLLSFALPAWLLSIPLSNLLNSEVLALAVALFVVHAAGVVPAGLCTVLALRHRATGTRLEEVFHE